MYIYTIYIQLHKYMNILVHIYVCVCVCVCVRARHLLVGPPENVLQVRAQRLFTIGCRTHPTSICHD